MDWNLQLVRTNYDAISHWRWTQTQKFSAYFAIRKRHRCIVASNNILMNTTGAPAIWNSSKLIAEVGHSVPVDQVRAGLMPQASPGDAINDFDAPIGQQHPSTALTGPGRRIIRDAMVRQYVLQRAEGKCEYCNSLGFLLPNDYRYLECHHVEGLAQGGPDTIDNVIALCANDHRAAHFGIDKLAVSDEMLKKITEKNKARKKKR